MRNKLSFKTVVQMAWPELLPSPSQPSSGGSKKGTKPRVVNPSSKPSRGKITPAEYRRRSKQQNFAKALRRKNLRLARG